MMNGPDGPPDRKDDEDLRDPHPSLLLDLDVLERNLARMAGRAAALGVALRPHVKTHKCLEVAARQRDLGAPASRSRLSMRPGSSPTTGSPTDLGVPGDPVPARGDPRARRSG